MKAQTFFATPRPAQTFAAAAVGTIIALSLLGAVGTLFQSRGEPLAQLVAAERACASHAYQSDRQACMNKRVAASRATVVAAH